VNERNWRTSSYSGGQGNCVQVGTAGRAVAIRDSADHGGPELILTPAQWETFLVTWCLRAANDHDEEFVRARQVRPLAMGPRQRR
jgi:Domain of unknown function (DUF397)